jgi:hypothetical protein
VSKELEACARAITYLPDPSRADSRDSTDLIGESITKIEIEVSDATARSARKAGLLIPEALERLLTDAIKRRQTADALLASAERRRGKDRADADRRDRS